MIPKTIGVVGTFALNLPPNISQSIFFRAGWDGHGSLENFLCRGRGQPFFPGLGGAGCGGAGVASLATPMHMIEVKSPLAKREHLSKVRIEAQLSSLAK